MSYQRGVRPDYTVGTITLVAGDVNFTTTGASLESAVIQGGDTIMTADGRTLIIDEITGQNSGTLIYPCPAEADGADLPLRIRFQPDGSRFQGAARELVVKLDSGNLDAIAGLQGYAGAIIKFTGAGTAELVDVTDIQMSDPHHNLAELAALAKAANQFVIMGADGSVTLKPISELTDAIENNRLAIVSNDQEIADLKSGTSEQYTRGDGTHAAMNKAAVGLSNVENIAPADLPISTLTQNALSGKLSLTGGDLSGGVNLRSNTDSAVRFFNGNAGNYGYTMFFDNNNGTADNGLRTFSSTFGDIHTLTNSGNLTIRGTIAKGGGTFLIDHPLDPLNKNLRHGFVESTEYLNLYRGLGTLENGRFDIDIDAVFGMSDGTFAALNADVMVTSLQNQNGFERVCIQGDPSTGKFTIVCENETSTAVIAWMVSGRRKDAFVLHLDENCERGTGRFIPEYDKEDA